MNLYQFISSLVGSLAWPITIVVCVLVFRRQLVKLLPRLRMKYQDLDVSFRLEQAEKEAKELPAPTADRAMIDTPTKEERTRFERLAEVSPRAALLDARAEFEEAVQMKGIAAGLNGKALSIVQVVRYLRELGFISSAMSALIDHLRTIGNAAAHKNQELITKDDARRYRDLVDLLISKLPMRDAAPRSQYVS